MAVYYDTTSPSNPQELFLFSAKNALLPVFFPTKTTRFSYEPGGLILIPQSFGLNFQQGKPSGRSLQNSDASNNRKFFGVSAGRVDNPQNRKD